MSEKKDYPEERAALEAAKREAVQAEAELRAVEQVGQSKQRALAAVDEKLNAGATGESNADLVKLIERRALAGSEADAAQQLVNARRKRAVEAQQAVADADKRLALAEWPAVLDALRADDEKIVDGLREACLKFFRGALSFRENERATAMTIARRAGTSAPLPLPALTACDSLVGGNALKPVLDEMKRVLDNAIHQHERAVRDAAAAARPPMQFLPHAELLIDNLPKVTVTRPRPEPVSRVDFAS